MANLNPSFFVDAATTVPEKFDFYLQAQFDRFYQFAKAGGFSWGDLGGNIMLQTDLVAYVTGGGAWIIDEGDELGVGWNIVFDDNGATG